MEQIFKKAKAKINLTLEVLEKRPDNYHNIKSIFQTIYLYDELYIEKIQNNKIELYTNVEELNNENNIIYKAYYKLKEKYTKITGVKVILKKRIPMQAGLGGGSTDCATFISCMNKLFKLNMNIQEQREFGEKLGADVPACLHTGTLLAEGIGEKIDIIQSNLNYYVIVIKPQISCSTKEMYQKLDERKKVIQKDNTINIKLALEQSNFNLLTKNVYNVFEEIIDEKDIIQNLKKELEKNGAKASLMAGSGSCIFGIFDNKNIAKQAYNKLKQQYETYICKTCNKKGLKYDRK